MYMKKFNHVLLTNDDGFDSEFLLIIRDLLGNYAEKVTVIAPLTLQSGKSSALTCDRLLEVKKIGENYFAVDGTPCDCVNYALHASGLKFDLVVSGCNNGENIGHDSMYSGTCGAALDACFYEHETIAFSAPHQNKEIVKNEFENVMNYILEHNLLSKDYVLNVNFPNSDKAEGIKITRLTSRRDKVGYAIVHGMYGMTRDVSPEKDGITDTDWYCFNNKITSITPIKPSTFDEQSYKKLSK